MLGFGSIRDSALWACVVEDGERQLQWAPCVVLVTAVLIVLWKISVLKGLEWVETVVILVAFTHW